MYYYFHIYVNLLNLMVRLGTLIFFPLSYFSLSTRTLQITSVYNSGSVWPAYCMMTLRSLDEASIPSDHLSFHCDVSNILQIQNFGFVIFFCVYHCVIVLYAPLPYPFSYSGVCSAVGGECRLLHPRFVVSALTLSLSACACMIKRPFHRKPTCVYLIFNVFHYSFCIVFIGYKHEDCI